MMAIIGKSLSTVKAALNALLSKTTKQSNIPGEKKRNLRHPDTESATVIYYICAGHIVYSTCQVLGIITLFLVI